MSSVVSHLPSELFPRSPGERGIEAPKPTSRSLGLRHAVGGGHAARSMMLMELKAVLAQTSPSATPAEIEGAIVETNILDKPTLSSRRKSLHHLRQLYGLDSGQALFRILRDFAQRDAPSIPLLALACAYCRDPLLQQSFNAVLRVRVGDRLSREAMESHLETTFPGRFSPATRRSTAQNVITTWTYSGHLVGKVKKVRRLPECRPEAAAYAMFAGYLTGLRGQPLLESTFGQLVAKDPSILLAQLPLAAARGLIGFKFAGGIFEFDFSRLLTPDEQRICDVAA